MITIRKSAEEDKKKREKSSKCVYAYFSRRIRQRKIARLKKRKYRPDAVMTCIASLIAITIFYLLFS